jgi:hypothetical protein
MIAASLAYYALVWGLRSVSAAPVPDIDNQVLAALGNRTALRTEFAPSWATTSNVRGTSDIIWSCVVTLTLSVYTAVHLNVPRAGESELKKWSAKLKWVLVAIFAPEIILYTALQQWRAARSLIRELNSLRRSVKSGIKLTHVRLL